MASERPATSKPRGSCKFYATSRGCFAGIHCKFLHGETEKLTPYDKNKSCKFYSAGYCRRGAQCWFLHGQPYVSGSAGTPEASGSSSATEEPAGSEDDENLCCICLEKPVTYGLLGGCSHIFCIQCIRNWRDRSGKSEDVIYSGVTKKCPLCRAPSRYVIPSSLFFPDGDPRRNAIINQYKASMARVPCRYFRESPPDKRFCPFGNDCFYQHTNADGTRHQFEHGVDHYMKLYKRRSHFANLPSNPTYDAWDDLSTALDAIRANFPAFLGRLMAESGDAGLDDVSDEDPSEPENNDGVVHPSEQDVAALAESFLAGLFSFGDEPLRRERRVYRFGSITPRPPSPPDDAAESRVSSPGAAPSVRPFDLLHSTEDVFDHAVTVTATPITLNPTDLSGAFTSPSATIDTIDSQPRIIGDVDLVETSEHSPPSPAIVDPESHHLAVGDEIAPNGGLIAGIEGLQGTEEGTLAVPHSELQRLQDSNSPQDAAPPFLTDGRGRVVWSSAASPRGCHVRGRTAHLSAAPPQLKAIQEDTLFEGETRLDIMASDETGQDQSSRSRSFHPTLDDSVGNLWR